MTYTDQYTNRIQNKRCTTVIRPDVNIQTLTDLYSHVYITLCTRMNATTWQDGQRLWNFVRKSTTN